MNEFANFVNGEVLPESETSENPSFLKAQAPLKQGMDYLPFNPQGNIYYIIWQFNELVYFLHVYPLKISYFYVPFPSRFHSHWWHDPISEC